MRWLALIVIVLAVAMVFYLGVKSDKVHAGAAKARAAKARKAKARKLEPVELKIAS